MMEIKKGGECWVGEIQGGHEIISAGSLELQNLLMCFNVNQYKVTIR